MSGGSQVNLVNLPLQQLDHLKNQVEQELEYFSNSLNQLRVCQTKLTEASESVCTLRDDRSTATGGDILVPLTSSLYVPGKLCDVDKVLIEIGTGYYVEKNLKDAEDFYKRKMEFLIVQIEKVANLLQEKAKLKQAVVEVMQLKIQASMALQQQSGVAKS